MKLEDLYKKSSLSKIKREIYKNPENSLIKPYGHMYGSNYIIEPNNIYDSYMYDVDKYNQSLYN